MAKKPKPGKCVHSLSNPIDLNWDHVFPRSWYPDTTLPNLYKRKIPSCIECNKELGKIEEEFLIRVGLCLNPNDPASQGIVKKALRAMNPKAAKNHADKQAREALSKRVVSGLLQGSQIPSTGIYPNFNEKWGRPVGSGMAVTIPANSFRRITEKIVRGIFFIKDGRYIEPPYSIQFYALDSAGATPIRDLLDKFGETFAREPGVVVRRAVTPEDGVSSLFEIEFWGQFKTHASVTASSA